MFTIRSTVTASHHETEEAVGM